MTSLSSHRATSTLARDSGGPQAQPSSSSFTTTTTTVVKTVVVLNEDDLSPVSDWEVFDVAPCGRSYTLI
jgi:hypothetical protein